MECERHYFGVILRIAAVALLIDGTIWAQQKPAVPPKPFTPPVILPIKDPIISKDEGCAEDLAHGVVGMKGLAQQKHFAELYVYGCARLVRGTYRVKLTAFRTIKVGSEQIITNGVDLLGIDGDGNISDIIHGWVLARQLTTTWDLQQALEAAYKAAQKESGKQ